MKGRFKIVAHTIQITVEGNALSSDRANARATELVAVEIGRGNVKGKIRFQLRGFRFRVLPTSLGWWTAKWSVEPKN